MFVFISNENVKMFLKSNLFSSRKTYNFNAQPVFYPKRFVEITTAIWNYVTLFLLKDKIILLYRSTKLDNAKQMVLFDEMKTLSDCNHILRMIRARGYYLLDFEYL